MIHLKTREEMDAIARGGAIIGELYRIIGERVRPGATTGELDRFIEEFVRSYEGAVPAFKGLYGFPASACISVSFAFQSPLP